MGCQSCRPGCVIGPAYLCSCGEGGSSSTLARPLDRCMGLSSESGRTPGSARRGDAFSATESEGALGECAWKGRFFLAGDETGMLEACDRKAEKEGTVILERELVLRRVCVWLCTRETSGCGAGSTEGSACEEVGECE